ncbi:copper resistance protein NlpE [Echinicola vietnamensis]|uniref:Putative lipoprotein NlpE involved in copper resistance n=1 Tax=Echinicola vietnamensis (strain DSM 17526 / LMG 23754 / KMM 6221) TaxID=926556 RepID=L0FR70_ECHVK|nr:copper resistance protein NlpE [Echinicola vietnamensis]AGA76444.1 putative lipoprotein NlpE involved in copper resistance [Echinicola vietnamensis DSM 17526]
MKKLLPYVFILGFVMACDKPAEETANEALTTENTPDPADKILQKEGSTWFTYEGTVPCADCSGIEMTLRLENRAEKNEREYKLTQVYLGTPDGNRAFESSGIYEVSYGMDGNPGAMIITLLDEHDTPIKHFLQEKDSDRFIMLDSNKKMISSDLNYSLTIK